MHLFVKHSLQELHFPLKWFVPKYVAWQISADFKFAVANFDTQRDGPNSHIDFRRSVDNIIDQNMYSYMLRLHAVVEYLHHENILFFLIQNTVRGRGM